MVLAVGGLSDRHMAFQVAYLFDPDGGLLVRVNGTGSHTNLTFPLGLVEATGVLVCKFNVSFFDERPVSTSFAVPYARPVAIVARAEPPSPVPPRPAEEGVVLVTMQPDTIEVTVAAITLLPVKGQEPRLDVAPVCDAVLGCGSQPDPRATITTTTTSTSAEGSATSPVPSITPKADADAGTGMNTFVIVGIAAGGALGLVTAALTVAYLRARAQTKAKAEDPASSPRQDA